MVPASILSEEIIRAYHDNGFWQVQVETQEDFIVLDAATQRNLELTTNLKGGTENTLNELSK